MRNKLYSIFIVLLFYCLIGSLVPVHADFASAYQDFSYTYQQYKSASNDFQIAKSSYLTYRTLTSQNEAINKFRSVLKARDEVMITYYSLLQEKMNSIDGLSSDSKSTFNSIKESEKQWLMSNQKEIEAAASFEDLNSISAQFEKRHPQMDTETKQAIGTIESAKLTILKDMINVQIDALSQKLSEISNSGIDTNTANRGIISAKSKLDLFSQKMSAVQTTFTPKQNSSEKINLFNGQRQLIEANQYLRETTDYLLEIVKSFTT